MRRVLEVLGGLVAIWLVIVTIMSLPSIARYIKISNM
jgi:hypothetical protein